MYISLITSLLNGNKTWISNGSVSDLAIVIATVDKSLGAKGLAAALVDRRQTPYEARELEKLGLKSFPTSELFFDNIFVPEENIVVPPGQALKATMRTFELAMLTFPNLRLVRQHFTCWVDVTLCFTCFS